MTDQQTFDGTRARALVVEDDPGTAELLALALRQDHLEVHQTELGEEALGICRDLDPDVVTLDLSLPDMDGVELCRRLREFSDAYVVMVTGRSEEIDRLVGLEMGADEYLSKPVNPRELRARVAALLRRPRAGARRPERSEVVEHGRLVLDLGKREALLDGSVLPLTPAELDVLSALAARPGEARQRDDLVRDVWQGSFEESGFLVDVHVASIRRKLRRAGERHRWIETVAGDAYRFRQPS
ncbi:response regulator transcription factor [Nocardioides sp. GCM10027113]|uniref:response regulator transcription factor n=1 Tax=unclassified Nocardioides TaxID=2615069 RepID=UPI0036237C4B